MASKDYHNNILCLPTF